MKITYVSGYTGTCKSHKVKELEDWNTVVLGSPTKFILGVDSVLPHKMVEPTSMVSYYAQLYSLSEHPIDKDKHLIVERGVWDYLAYHYCFNINEVHTPNYKDINIDYLHDRFLRLLVDNPHQEHCHILYNDCDRLIDIVKNSPEMGRSHAFDERGDVEFYRGRQDQFVEIVTYYLDALSIPYTIETITSVDF